jgi:23S rRNA (adenine2503-C2)-methyltransferase
LPEQIERLAAEDISPRLAISLNAPTDAIRKRLMPIAAKFPLDRLLSAVELYQSETRNRVTFEYVLIKGVNDTVTLAKMLVKLLRPFMCNVNLIEYNPHPGCPGFSASSREAIKRFALVLNDAGIETTVRLKMGQSINAACGQLGAKGL